MKFIHCADLHLDSKMETLPSEKSRNRREELLRTFERMCAYATENSVTAVIIAGDMFDTSRTTNKTRERILSAIKFNSSVDFLYLSGNHDENFLESIEELPGNLKVFTDKWQTFNYEDVSITGTILSPRNISYVYDTLNLEEDRCNIVTLHGQLVGYKGEAGAEVISLPMLKNKHVDYLALGHIHTFSDGAIDLRGKYAYCGCLEGRGFDETGDKGFVLIEVQNKKIKYEFIKFSSRNLYDFEFDVTGIKSWLTAREEIINNLIENYEKESLIKVIVKGSCKPDFDLDKDGLTALLNERFFYAKVYDKTQLQIDISDYAVDKSVRGEFVRAVWESELDLDEKNKIITCGLNALKGEDF